ncbi:Beta-ribofuranosylaminobenzene 5'-phosphate synthase [Candidatus Gugararchaeum adminiculabundum]|nr:Beta-ribofuranosylaminobenzene 5'-phosphate synthase [Candidatus Gugararchaeum adminiculabundum]
MNRPSKVLVSSPSRLHFCLVDLNGSLGRSDLSVGVALEEPRCEVEAIASSTIKITGSSDPRINQILSKLNCANNCNLPIKQNIPEHVGLGSSTQLLMAVAKAASIISGKNYSTLQLAELAQRGGTSGIGVHAFASGGFLVDAGHSFGKKGVKASFSSSSFSSSPAPQLLARYELPESWHFACIIPDSKKFFGEKENEIFQSKTPVSEKITEQLSRAVLVKLMPAAVEQNAVDFGESLNLLNQIRLADNWADPALQKYVKQMISAGALGAGISSFGPLVYGFTDSKNKAEKILSEFDCTKFVSKIENKGARVRTSD